MSLFFSFLLVFHQGASQKSCNPLTFTPYFYIHSIISNYVVHDFLLYSVFYRKNHNILHFICKKVKEITEKPKKAP